MSNQKPVYPPPQHYPFSYLYPPPYFPSPYPPPPPPNSIQPPPSRDHMPPPPYPMPPYGYPPPHMMYPPMHQPYYNYYHQGQHRRPHGEQQEVRNGQQTSTGKDPRKHGKLPLKEKKSGPIQIVLLSDEEPQPQPEKRQPRRLTRSDIKKEKQMQQGPTIEKKPRKANKKAASKDLDDELLLNAFIQQKKRIIKQHQKKMKLVQEQDQDVKHITEFLKPASPHNRHSTRTRMLTAKDGRGKILIGDKYQADLPSFLVKDQSFSVWTQDTKKQILARTFK